jgi:hypothetical protein
MAGVANKALWLALKTAIARHRHIEFTWVKAHSGLSHNEIGDTLATRGVKGGTYCPTDWFDELAPDTEQEDDPSIPNTEVITQTEEWADEEHLPTFGTREIVYGFNEEETAEAAETLAAAEAAEHEKAQDRGLRHFLHEVMGNSSTPVTEDEDDHVEAGIPVVKPGMTVVDVDSELPEPSRDPEFHLQEGHVGAVDLPAPVAPYAWSSTWAQAREEAARRQAEEERFSWMKDADLQMLSMGLEPVPWEQFAEAISHTGESQFQAIEQRACGEQVLETGEQPGPGSLVGATSVVRSLTVITALRRSVTVGMLPVRRQRC